MPPFRTFARACLALAFASLPLAAWAQEAPWPMAGGDPEHRGVASGPRPPLRKAWTATIGEPGAVAGVAVADGKVVAVGWDRVVALDATDGGQLWELPRRSGPAGPPAIAGTLAVFADGALLVGASLEDGSVVWRRTLLSPVVGPLTVDAGTIYAGTRRGDVLALDGSNGRTVWQVEAPGRVETSPAVSGSFVIVVAEDYDSGTVTVLALDAANGKVRWRSSPEGIALGSSSAAIAGDVVVAGMGDLRVHGLRLRNGEELWTVRGRAAYGARFVPSTGAGAILGDRLGHVVRLDPETGAERWLYRVPGDLLLGGPVILDERWVAVGDGAGAVSVIDVRSGRLAWSRVLGAKRIEALAADGERLYAAERGGSVTAFTADADGRLLDEPSPTTLFPARAVGSWAVAAVPLYLALLLLFRTLGKRGREGALDEPASEGRNE